MKRLTMWGVTLGTLIGVLALAQLPPPPDAPTSAAAAKSLAAYKTAVRALDEDYARKFDTLRRQYVKELDIARKSSLAKEDLDEAQRLLAEKRRIEAEGSQPGVPKGLAILCALHGIDDKWVDITSFVRGHVKDAQFRYTPGDLSFLPDVASGRHKTIMIAYTFDGKPQLLVTREDSPISLPAR